MSRLRIIRDGAYSWLDEGPGDGSHGPSRFRGGPIESAPSTAPYSDHRRERLAEYQRRKRAKSREQAA